MNKKFHLSKREIEVLNLLVKGFNNPEIGLKLKISDNTAKAHVCKIINKLNARNRVDAAVIAVKNNLV